jgi:hypothetical protein
MKMKIDLFQLNMLITSNLYCLDFTALLDSLDVIQNGEYLKIAVDGIIYHKMLKKSWIYDQC